ncbi:MAG: addiction module protein [Pirellulaceae bacterium]
MSQAADELLKTALALPEDEQLAFAAALVSVLDERRVRPFDDAWLAEAERRSMEYDAGAASARPWQEVKERARQGAKLRG